jgi:hypothetical protein
MNNNNKSIDDNVSDEALEDAFQQSTVNKSVKRFIPRTTVPVRRTKSTTATTQVIESNVVKSTTNNFHSNMAKSIYHICNNWNVVPVHKSTFFLPNRTTFIYSSPSSKSIHNTVASDEQMIRSEKMSFSLGIKSEENTQTMSSNSKKSSKFVKKLQQFQKDVNDYDSKCQIYSESYCSSYLPRIKQSGLNNQTEDICIDKMDEDLLNNISDIVNNLHQKHGGSVTTYVKEKKKQHAKKLEEVNKIQKFAMEEDDEPINIFDDVDDDYSVTVTTKDNSHTVDDDEEEVEEKEEYPTYVRSDTMSAKEEALLRQQIEDAKRKSEMLHQWKSNQTFTKRDYESGYAAMVQQRPNDKTSDENKKKSEKYLMEVEDPMSEEEEEDNVTGESEPNAAKSSFQLVLEHQTDKDSSRRVEPQSDMKRDKSNKKRGREWQQIQDIIKKKKEEQAQ